VAGLFRELYYTDHPAPTFTDTTTDTVTPTASGRQAGRRRRADARVEERMEIWTPELLRLKQSADHDIHTVIQWITDDSRPD